jgi:hypothetical protein
MVDESANTPCYVARCLCGCGRVVFASVDDGTTPKETAKSIAKMIRNGYSIERMKVGDVRAADWICEKKLKVSV